jgi:hypothetical protein
VTLPELAAVARLLDPLPTAAGGAVLVMASGDSPPATALLSTGDVLLRGTTIQIAVHAGSSVARRLSGGCAVVVPDEERVLRMEITPAEARRAGPLDLIEGEVVAIRPTGEPPWTARMTFAAVPGGDVQPALDYWTAVRSWLIRGASGDGPAPPISELT